MIFDIMTTAICLCSFALCLWVFLRKDNPTAGRWISLVVGLLFLVALPIMFGTRYLAQRHDYVSAQQMRVQQGEINTCERPWVEQHTEWVIAFWSRWYPESEVRAALRDKLLVCSDDASMTSFGRKLAGYATGSAAVIFWRGSTQQSEGLLKHEESHLVLDGNGVPWDEALQHAIFKEKGLGY